jgi:hypothetical protein
MNIKDKWAIWRASTPADKDMLKAFESACTSGACHSMLVELESANQKIAELDGTVKDLEEAAKSFTYCNGFFQPINRNTGDKT